MKLSRRTLLSAFSVALPFGIGSRIPGSEIASEGPPLIRFRSFETAVRAAFAGPPESDSGERVGDGDETFCRRIEVGDSELVRAGLQGCQNDRPFAGFAEGALRIVRTGFAPGPARRGARLYVSTIDIALTDSLTDRSPGRPLDFTSLPPAPSFV